MPTTSLRRRMLSGEYLLGCFLRTATHEIVELFALTGIDFICFDAEHSPLDRRGLDAALGMAKALDLPAIVRVTHAAPEAILSALDCGAAGILVPHIATVEMAEDVARWSRYGHGGRGSAPTNRAGSFGTRPMPEIVVEANENTAVLAMIEDPEAVDDLDRITAVEGLDGFFVGQGDLGTAYTAMGKGPDDLKAAVTKIDTAVKKAGKCLCATVPGIEGVPALRARGVSMVWVGSEHNLIINGGREIAALKDQG